MSAGYGKISDYGVVGDLTTVALVGLDGSIDWLCLPHIDSPSVFGALLDARKGGRFAVTPAGDRDSTAEYLPGTNILRTLFRTSTGLARVTDFMPLPAGEERFLERDRQELLRLLEVTGGKMRMVMEFTPRFDYARAPTVVGLEKGELVARSDRGVLVLTSSRPFTPGDEGGRVEWDLARGERIWLRLFHGETPPPLEEERLEESLKATASFWRGWLKESETGRSVDVGAYGDRIDRSALVLKLLSFQPTGAIAAAATTSLPEEIGGVRNWDYRYTWIRDTSFTLQALFNLGHLAETEAFLQWVEGLLSEHGAAGMQIMYGVRGEERLPEEELPHLEGYKGSKPVRIGNDAARQRQLDIYGEIMDSALKLSDYVGKIDAAMWPFFRDICDHVAGHWRERDAGIWEVRGGPYHFVYSKVMCWVALDRGLTIAKRYGFHADLEGWRSNLREIREEVLERGWSEKKKAFVQHYETESLDASTLLIPLMGFLPIDDRRVSATIDAVRDDLGRDGLLYRYRSEDGLPGDEGVFLLCSFWLAQCLVARGDFDGAGAVLRSLEEVANHLGLFPEEYDLRWKEALGNFPQAFTHIGYINAVLALRQALAEKRSPPSVPRHAASRGLFAGRVTLNEGESRREVPPREVVPRLKEAMNVLRGAFFDTSRGRVAYERMSESGAYGEYLDLTGNLRKMDLDELVTREERIAFWINLYNVIVIHAVIDLGIRDSVREVAGFFGKVRYQVGDALYSPDDIEHGVLRGNRPPPRSLFRPFRQGDPRLGHSIDPVDPRVHFALVCASSSCPPIGVYRGETLDRELTVAGETFLNAGGVELDREGRRVFLSRIFKWYGGDFANRREDLLRFIAPYLHRREDREFLQEEASTLSVAYQAYDWRLNRY